MSVFDPAVLFDDTSGHGASYRFSGRTATLTAWQPDRVVPLLEAVERLVSHGRYAAGFISYEAAAALSPHLPSETPCPGLPLAWFALFERRHEVLQPAVSPEPTEPPLLQPAVSPERYYADLEAIRQLIACGDCYQANYTFPARGRLAGEPLPFYRALALSQQAPYCAFIDTGGQQILSASPELFFRTSGRRIETRPMKGTGERGRHPEEDCERARSLLNDPKERAENLMIVDLLRNDLGMIAEHGSVRVESLFDVESFPTVHQLTSRISARLRQDIGLVGILRALFPCGSVTGAPKRRAMEILAEREQRPRGVYCGAIGTLAPGDEMVFSVAIRTVIHNRRSGSIELGVGSGITWDSDPAAELRECHAKTAFALRQPPGAGLIESLRLEGGCYPLLEAHLDRLGWSAGRLGIAFDRHAARSVLQRHAAGLAGVCKVRLVLQPTGALEVSAETVLPDEAPLQVAISSCPVDPQEPGLYLKRTDRSRYERIRAEHPACDEVLMINTRGELTEGTYHNLVLRLAGRLVTPPLSSGLLPGVMRGNLLKEGIVSERVLTPSDLAAAQEMWLINAVRGWRKCTYGT